MQAASRHCGGRAGAGALGALVELVRADKPNGRYHAEAACTIECRRTLWHAAREPRLLRGRPRARGPPSRDTRIITPERLWGSRRRGHACRQATSQAGLAMLRATLAAAGCGPAGRAGARLAVKLLVSRNACLPLPLLVIPQ